MNFRQKMVMFLATGFYSGYAPFAPGTFGTIPGILICYFISGSDITIAFLYTLLVVIISIPIAHEAEKITGKNDPGCIVIDEIAGILVTLSGIPFNTTTVISGFIIFRFLDILKPFPIRYLEKKVPGGAGIVIDDVAAGVIANLILRGMTS
ncbi:MAG: phosphatidylglycerophosphatase A [Desulfobacteraceae bacterium]|nr:phosphatidylglycerophosphatase A [Desulfobacteraceae bacterium]